MQIGLVGLGRMGGNMAQRLLRDGHDVAGFDLDPGALSELESHGGTGKTSLDALVEMLDKPRTVWIMVPAGAITQSTVDELSNHMSAGDTLIDGGNSNYKESTRRAEQMAELGIDMLDSGTSGGVWGLENGYCLTIGGNREAYDRNLPIFKSLSPPEADGNLYVGPSGSGHYVKMIHNGIEYGMMQAFAEGLELLEAKSEFNLDLGAICENWRYGSVIRSWLLDLTADELKEDPGLRRAVFVCRRLGRRPLDSRCLRGVGRACAGDYLSIADALQVPAREPIWRTLARRDAQRVRRSQRQKSRWRITRRSSSPSLSSGRPETSPSANSRPLCFICTPSAHCQNDADSLHSPVPH